MGKLEGGKSRSSQRTAPDIYTHAMEDTKLAAQGQMLAAIFRQEPNGGKLTGENGLAGFREFPLSDRRNGRHEETRTPDLYRVNLFLLNTFNNLTGLLGLPKYL